MDPAIFAQPATVQAARAKEEGVRLLEFYFKASEARAEEEEAARAARRAARRAAKRAAEITLRARAAARAAAEVARAAERAAWSPTRAITLPLAVRRALMVWKRDGLAGFAGGGGRPWRPASGSGGAAALQTLDVLASAREI